ncbi:DUF2550 domain-containing protein [Corynebacterium gerontici]|uniref:DUF2550 domain-containing protein n=1 Tax=Corynebacterium gerontici TaxID=2079234 RepID=A0A3G6IZX4_9CORY|nr:DUF2550 domain-containing protein [Corynebacterium gerontici]AZA11247.1 hypothetical protein CGERO_04655 [Corynebacterium gerontici]
MRFFLLLLALLCAVCALLVAWRFATLRSRGTTVSMRKLPASGEHGWRYGLLRYSGSTVEYFKLRSIVPFANVTFRRNEVQLRGHRELTVREASFLSPATRVVTMSCGEDTFEIALEPRAEMAFTAWVEAAPDARMDRIDAKSLRRKMSGNGQRS